MSNIILGGGTSGSGSVTLQAPNTNSNQIHSLPDRTGNLMMDGPAFSAYPSTNLSFNSQTNTKIVFDVEQFDTANCFASSRFTPNVAGYYQLNCSICPTSGTGTGYFSVYLYKNGNLYGQMSENYISSAAYYGYPGAFLIYLNGSTDYVELYMSANSSGAVYSNNSGAIWTYFQAYLVRAA